MNKYREKHLTDVRKSGTNLRKNRRESRNAEKEDRIIFPFFYKSYSVTTAFIYRLE
jgi:hypothetical protein